jgi:hypothetical protein
MLIAGSRHGIIYGTLNAGGTLSQEIDLGEWTLGGLIAETSFGNGTLTFQVSSKADADGGLYVDLRGDQNAVYNPAGGAVSGTFALSSQSVVVALAGYRYVKIKSSIAQTSGVRFALPVKA